MRSDEKPFTALAKATPQLVRDLNTQNLTNTARAFATENHWEAQQQNMFLLRYVQEEPTVDHVHDETTYSAQAFGVRCDYIQCISASACSMQGNRDPIQSKPA